jgi:hypothetical protein
MGFNVFVDLSSDLKTMLKSPHMIQGTFKFGLARLICCKKSPRGPLDGPYTPVMNIVESSNRILNSAEIKFCELQTHWASRFLPKLCP